MSSGKQRRKRIQEKSVQYSNQDTSSDLSAAHTPQYIAISEEITGGKHKKTKKAEKLSSTAELPANNGVIYRYTDWTGEQKDRFLTPAQERRCRLLWTPYRKASFPL